MSRAHLAAIDPLVALFDEALAALAAGTAPDLETFTDELTTRFAALEALGPIDPAQPLAERCRAQFEALDARRARLMALLGEVHGETGQRLARLSSGRRGIGAYRASLDSGRRGHGRGQG